MIFSSQMDCPVCKYPNAAGATHCGMCYEVFNRSAADAYLQAVKRERRQEEGPSLTEPTAKTTPLFSQVSEGVQSIDWSRVTSTLLSLVMKSRSYLILGGGVILLWLAAGWLLSPELWYHLTGKKLTFEFPLQETTAYMVNSTENIRTWSERNGRLDTPLEEFQVEELGNIFFQSEKKNAKNQTPILLRVKEWIQILHDTGRPSASGIPLSHTIPLSHPSLADTHFLLDKKGFPVDRHPIYNTRSGKVFPFLITQFPTHTIRHGQTWSEHVEWIDLYNDWKIHWVGTLHWTAGELAPCFNETCVQLSYQADLQPQLWAAPAWADKAVHEIQPQVSTDGAALFDAAHHRLVSNLFSYDGMLRIPIKDLGHIPRQMRVGRRIKNTPGEIILRFENKIDLHKS